MIPQMSPYTPELYQPDSFGRYRKYPHFVETPIPGAGFKVGELVWAEQELNLDGGPPQVYGSYSRVPLRGLGAASAGLRMNVPRAPSMMASRPSSTATAQTQVARRVPAPPPMRPSMRFSSPEAPRMSMQTMRHRQDRARTTLSRSGERTMAHQGNYATAAPMYSEGGGRGRRDDDVFLERSDAEAHDLGQTFDLALPAASMTALKPRATAQTALAPASSSPAPRGDSGLPTAEDYGFDVAAEIAAAAAAAEQAAANMQQPAEQPTAFLKRKVGPVPYWVIGIGGAVVVSGGLFYFMRR